MEAGPQGVSVDAVIEVLAYLISAARTQLDEAAEYAPMRMLTAASRLADALPDDAPRPVRELADAILGVPPTATPSTDPEAYTAMVDRLCAALTDCLLALDPGTTTSSDPDAATPDAAPPAAP